MLKCKVVSEGGFTFLELLLSIALIGVLAGVSLPVSEQWIQGNDLNIAKSTVGESWRRAQALAQGMAGDSAWGVSIDAGDNNQIVLFKGTSFASRDSSYDEVFDFPESLSVSGASEVVFSVFTGLPQSTGSATLTSDSGQSRVVVINAKGTVFYE